MNITKLKNNSGMTLSELLVATIIMLLVSLALTTGIALSNKQFVASIRQSEAQELYSNLSALLTSELKYTKTIYTTNSYDLNGNVDVKGFNSTAYALNDSKITPYIVSLNGVNEIDDYGEIAIGHDGTYNRLLGSGSYSKNLGAKVTIKYNESSKLFIVTLDIGVVGGESIKSETFNVFALNKVNKESIS